MAKCVERRFLHNDICDVRELNTVQRCTAVQWHDVGNQRDTAYPSEDGLHVWQVAKVTVLDLFKETSFVRFHVTSGIVDRFLIVGEDTLASSHTVKVDFFRELLDGESAVIVYHSTAQNNQTTSELKLLYCDIDQKKRLIKVKKEITVDTSHQKLEYCFVGSSRELYMIFRDGLPPTTIDRDVKVYRLDTTLTFVRQFALTFPAENAAAHDDEDIDGEWEGAAAPPAGHLARPPLHHVVCDAFEHGDSLYVVMGKLPNTGGLHLDIDLMAEALGQLLVGGVIVERPRTSTVALYRRRLRGSAGGAPEQQQEELMQVVQVEADAEDRRPTQLDAIGAAHGELLGVGLHLDTVSVWRLGFVDDDAARMRWQLALEARLASLFTSAPSSGSSVRVVVLPASKTVLATVVASARHASAFASAVSRRYVLIELAHPPPRRLTRICTDFLQRRFPRLPDHVNTDCRLPHTAGLYCRCAYV